MAFYKIKAVISGNVIEISEYENEVLFGYKDTKKKSKGRSSVANDDDKEINREKVFQRARKNLMRTINANYTENSKFLTLTFKDEMTDIRKANYELKKFIQRLNYYLEYNIKYSCVPEVQEERYKKYGVAVWHYHLVLYNTPQKLDIKKLRDIWSNGHIKINVIKDVDNVGAYICKYMTKNHKDRLRGEKMYFNSRGLNKPVEIKEPALVNDLLQTLQEQVPKYENTFANEYNSVVYKQYIINK